jgi:hypothetical protein
MADPDRESSQHATPAESLPDPGNGPRFEAIEERPEVVAAIVDDTTVTGLPMPEGDDDPDTLRFQPPGA